MALANYNIDFNKLVQRLLGARMRKAIRVAWLSACAKFIGNLHADFVLFAGQKNEELKWNGQTIVLENLLIEKFGAGIYIVNNQIEVNGTFVGEASDNGFYVGERNDQSQYVDVSYNISDVSFTVYVPSSIVFVQSEMEAYINKYKMFGTTYNIVII